MDIWDFFNFNKPVDLKGHWRRLEDKFQGCVVSVEERPGERGLVGVLVSVPHAMRDSGWKAGEVKWRDIVPLTGRTFSLNDTRKHYDRSGGTVRKDELIPYEARVSWGQLLFMKVPDSYEQRWVRHWE